jgi:serine/threonine protein kinase
VLDYNVEDGVPFLVMDYAPNGTLRHLHPDGTRLPLGTIVSYVKQLAAALQYAHNRYVIHCDVKPENMLVGRNGEILLSDFGIAKIAGAHEQDKVTGTLPYMAPEQIDGTPCAESDQYAVAMVVYEWLSGSCPFQGSREEIIYQHRYVVPPSLREQLPALPLAVELVIMKALSKLPADRYPSISAFAAALEQASRTRR